MSTLPDSPGGSRDLVFSHESLTDLGLSRISPGFLKDKPKNIQISPGSFKDNPENNLMQVYLSISLSSKMKWVFYITYALFWNIIFQQSRDLESQKFPLLSQTCWCLVELLNKQFPRFKFRKIGNYATSLFYSVLKRNISQTFKSRSCKKSFPSVYIIDKTCFVECFLFHVITERHFLHKFSVTQRFGVIAMLLRSLKQVFWKRPAFYVRYLQNNTSMLLMLMLMFQCC